jgi:hypothetical protein
MFRAAALAAMLAAAPLVLPPASAAAADPVAPTQKILGAADPVPLGELVTLAVSPPGDAPGLLRSSYEWKVFDGGAEKNLAVDAAGKVFFGAGVKPRKLLVVVAAAHLFRDDAAPQKVAVKTVILTAVVTIGEPDAPPPPQPAPPAVPDGELGLTRAAYDAAQALPPAARGAAGQFAANFEAVAGQARDGKVKGGAILAALAALNDKVIERLPADAWTPFFTAVEAKLVGLAQAGRLAADADYAQALAEIAAALRAVR